MKIKIILASRSLSLATILTTVIAFAINMNVYAEGEAKPLTEEEKALEKSLGLGESTGLKTRGMRTRGFTPRGASSEQVTRGVVTRGGFVPDKTRGGKMIKVDVQSSDTTVSSTAPQKNAAGAAPVKVYADSKAVFNNLLFVINSTQLADQASYDEINKLSRVLKAHPSSRFLIEGHTCDLGADEANQSLSWQRAEAVKSQLITSGIDSSRLVVRGFGETELPEIISPYKTEDQQESIRKKARRVVIRQIEM